MQDKGVCFRPLIGSDIWPVESRHFWWPWVTFKVIYLLQAFFKCNFRIIVQSSKNFNWPGALRGPSAIAELLVCLCIVLSVSKISQNVGVDYRKTCGSSSHFVLETIEFGAGGLARVMAVANQRSYTLDVELILRWMTAGGILAWYLNQLYPNQANLAWPFLRGTYRRKEYGLPAVVSTTASKERVLRNRLNSTPCYRSYWHNWLRRLRVGLVGV